ncbi:MAG TPA: SMP-30/gluconolactonase/LRE family protein [Bryobacteraceae bacterium]|jgi:gluconolactonase
MILRVPLFLGAWLFAGSAQSCLDAQSFSDVTVETVLRDAHYAEGPVWSPEGFLLFSDTVTDQIKKFTPGKGVSDYLSLPGGAAGNTYDDEGRLYVCEFHARRVTRTAKNGKTDILAARFEGKRLNAPSDIVVRRDGNAYFTDPAFGNQQDTRELDFYGVYRIKTNGELEAIARWKTRPNGIAISPNGRLLYVADSDARLIRVYDLAGNGSASNERVFVDKLSGVPGGLRTDEKGNVYAAAKAVFVYSPKGEMLKQIQLAETPSNLAFGDKDFSSLYVTARTTVYRVRAGGMKGAPSYAPQVP